MQGAVRWVYLRCTRGSKVLPDAEEEDGPDPDCTDTELAASPQKYIPHLVLSHGDSRDLLIPVSHMGSGVHGHNDAEDGGESARSQESSFSADVRAARDAVSRANSWASMPSARRPSTDVAQSSRLK